MIVPKYVETRLRRVTPTEHCIVPSSTPVIAFGNTQQAIVATLGLNPSRNEFQDRHGNLLHGSQQRLETLESLEVPSLTDASDVKIARVIERCNSYFTHQPYWTWFGQLEPILNAIGASYKAGTACHLDLVQWATDPVWAKIPSQATREQLIHADAAFLKQQLLSEQIQVLLLNGRSVIQSFTHMQQISLRWLPETLTHGRVRTQLVVGKGFQNVAIIGWTVNIQSSFGVSTELRQMLTQKVADLLPTLQHCEL